MVRRSAALHLAALALLMPQRAGADASAPSAADKETSRALYAQGMQALDAHDYATAERACGGAHALVKVPTSAACWARALEGLGRMVEARDAFSEAAHFPAKPDEPVVFTTARESSQAEAERLSRHIPTITLDVSGPSESTALNVTVDGAAVAPETARLPRKVNPGRHTIVVSAPGFAPVTVNVEVGEGADHHIPVALNPSGASAPAGARVGTAPAGETATTRGIGLPVWIAFGVGGAGLVVGSIFGAMALSDASGLRSRPGCPSNCPLSSQSQIDSLHGAQWGSDIGLGVGVIGLGVGTALLLISRPTEAMPTTSLHLDVGPGDVGLRGSF